MPDFALSHGLLLVLLLLACDLLFFLVMYLLARLSPNKRTLARPSVEVDWERTAHRLCAKRETTTEAFMGELKTQRTATSVDVIIRGIADDARREDCLTLLGMMKRATGVDPEVWSSGAIGFGTFHYKSASGQEATGSRSVSLPERPPSPSIWGWGLRSRRSCSPGSASTSPARAASTSSDSWTSILECSRRW